MKLRDHYDWMVLGDHPGALLSAGLAARLGLSVLVLPVSPAKRVVQLRDGQLLDPESNYVLGLGKTGQFNGLLAECLSRMGILPAELELIRDAHSLPQLLTPSLRLDFGLEIEGIKSDLRRELGKEASSKLGLLEALARGEHELLSHWLGLPERLTLVPGKSKGRPRGQSLSDVRRKILKESAAPQSRWLGTGRTTSCFAREKGLADAEQFLSGLWYGISGVTSDIPDLFGLLHLMTLGRTGASFRGGMTAYREFLLRLAGRLGAHIPPKAECSRVFVEKGRFIGVQIAQKGNMIGGGGAVVGCALSDLAPLVTMGGRNWFKRLKGSPKADGWMFTLAITVKADAISPGAGPRLIWKEADSPALEIEIVDPADYGVRRPDQRVIFARTVMPFSPESLQEEYQRMISARILRQVSEIMPFIESHVVEIFPEFRKKEVPEGISDFQQVYGFANLDAIPENLRCLSLGRARAVGSRAGIEGMFVASGESFPELGSFGGTVAALEAVSWLAHRAGLAGPFA